MHKSLLVLSLLILPVVAEVRKDPTKSNLPVDVRLIAKKTTFKLDFTAEDLRKQLKEAEKTGSYPRPPAIELALEVHNRSDKDVQVWHKGDPVTVTFEMTGPGVVTKKVGGAFTADFRFPEAVKVAPGKNATIPLQGLMGGFRYATFYTYWTEPGEYSLTATFNTAVSPAPEGFKADEQGFARVTITSSTIKIKVEGK